MSNIRSDEELFRDLLAQAGQRAPQAGGDLAGGARRRHRAHRLRQGSAGLAAIAILVVAGVSASSQLAASPGRLEPAAGLPTRAPTAAPATGQPLPNNPFTEMFAVLGGGTDTATTTSVSLVSADGKSRVRAIPNDVAPTSVVLGPSGRYVYWVSSTSNRQGQHSWWRQPVTGGVAVTLGDVPGPSTGDPFVVPDRADDAVAYPTSKGVIVQRLSGEPPISVPTSGEPIGWSPDDAAVIVETTKNDSTGARLSFAAVGVAAGAATAYQGEVAIDSATATCSSGARPTSVLPDGDVVTLPGTCATKDQNSVKLFRLTTSAQPVETTVSGLSRGVVRHIFPLANGSIGVTSTQASACPTVGFVGVLSPAGAVSPVTLRGSCD